MQEKETSLEFVQSVTVYEGTGTIDLFSLLEEGLIKDRVTGVQIASHDSALSVKDLGQLANSAFSIYPIPPEKISVSMNPFAKKDIEFAKQFGYTPVPYFACLKMIDNVGIEAWVNPVLLSPNHPLTHTRTLAAALSSTDIRVSSLPLPSLEPHVLGSNELRYKRYVRLTVLDEPLILANIAWAFADQDINIKGVEQPKTETGAVFAEIVFILSPCSGQNFATSLSKIKELEMGDGRKLCHAINTALPIV